MPQNSPIPKPHDINPDWLLSVLGLSVSAVAPKPVGTGQVGATFRFALDHSSGTGPASIIGKFMSDDPISRATGKAQLSYIREVNFYRHYGGKKPLPIPQILFTALDEESHEFALIMDDFPHHRAGNQLQPATLAEAHLAISAAAQIHAAWWGEEGLDQHAWLNGSRAAVTMNVDGLFNMLWPAFRQRYGHLIDDAIIATGESYKGRINAWVEGRSGPRCLTHGDFRPDNMLFNEADKNKPIIIVDWQTAGVGNGATDIAYYLGTALSPDLRRQHERELVSKWIQDLLAAGINESDTTALCDNYRRDAVSGFLMGVLASMIVEQTPRGDAMFLEMCARSAQMVQDHKSVDLI